MLKNPGGESLQAFLEIFTDTILDQVPDGITALSQVSSPAAREAPRQFRAIRDDLDDQTPASPLAQSSLVPGAISNSRASSAGMVIWFLPVTVVVIEEILIKDF